MANLTAAVSRKRTTPMGIVSRVFAYIVFCAWGLITILPLFWMVYSSFKSNEELILDIFAFPHALFDNANDEYVVIEQSLNVILPYDPEKDPRERLIIESTTIAPTRRLMVHHLVKEDLPPEIANRQPGELVYVNELPAAMRRQVSWSTVWFNYRSAITRGGLVVKFFNSVIYASVSTFLVILVSTMISFAVAKMGFKWMSTIIIAVIGLGYLISINSLIIPLFLMLSSFGLTDTRIGLIVVYAAFGVPLGVLLCSQFMRGLPDSLLESAYIDGANAFRVYRSLILPMSIPVIVTVSIISALGVWNEFLLCLVLTSSQTTLSLPVGVFAFASLTSTQLGWQLAALTIATWPVMIVYFIFNRRLSEGVIAGAVKG
jgi:raffinose/stachyose/melibiose transport system permease protein